MRSGVLLPSQPLSDTGAAEPPSVTDLLSGYFTRLGFEAAVTGVDAEPFRELGGVEDIIYCMGLYCIAISHTRQYR